MLHALLNSGIMLALKAITIAAAPLSWIKDGGIHKLGAFVNYSAKWSKPQYPKGNPDDVLNVMCDTLPDKIVRLHVQHEGMLRLLDEGVISKRWHGGYDESDAVVLAKVTKIYADDHIIHFEAVAEGDVENCIITDSDDKPYNLLLTFNEIDAIEILDPSKVLQIENDEDESEDEDENKSIADQVKALSSKEPAASKENKES